MMKKAFSLVEVLVTVSIVSTLVALLLPAINSSRESARSVSCRNNLRQMGLAVQHHEQSLGHMPGAGWGSSWTGDPDMGSGARQPGSWNFSLLPYLDSKEIHNMASDGDPVVITSVQKEGALRAGMMSLDFLNCPSRRSSSPSPASAENVWNMDPAESLFKSDYAVNAGDNVVRWASGPAPADALLGQGFADMKLSTGVAHQRSQLKFDHIKDGLSNTYLMGEKRLCLSDPSQDDNGAFSGADTDNARWTDMAPGVDSEEPGFNFGSAHQGVFHMLMCDGSVNGTDYSIELEVHSSLGNRKR